MQQTIQTAEDTGQADAQAQVAQAEANLAQAELNLSYTEVRAPQDGRITKRNVDPGTFVQAGQQSFYIVTPQVWITANFKETQLNRHASRSAVDDRTVDAYPNLEAAAAISTASRTAAARGSPPSRPRTRPATTSRSCAECR